MSIQQSINQGLGIAALLASQSPMAAAHKEKVLNQAAVKSEEKALNTQREALAEASKQYKQSEDIDTAGIYQKEVHKTLGIMERLQQLNPKKYTEPYISASNLAGKLDKAYQKWQNAEQEANVDLAVKSQSLQKGRSKMGFETRKSMILDQYANPLEVKNER